jgi:hypothetical protein
MRQAGSTPGGGGGKLHASTTSSDVGTNQDGRADQAHASRAANRHAWRSSVTTGPLLRLFLTLLVGRGLRRRRGPRRIDLEESRSTAVTARAEEPSGERDAHELAAVGRSPSARLRAPCGDGWCADGPRDSITGPAFVMRAAEVPTGTRPIRGGPRDSITGPAFVMRAAEVPTGTVNAK